jgi:hypothetical protein
MPLAHRHVLHHLGSGEPFLHGLSQPKSRDQALCLGSSMITKIAMAALVGALSGSLAATRGVFWPPSSGTHASYSERVIARVEAAWNAMHRHTTP